MNARAADVGVERAGVMNPPAEPDAPLPPSEPPHPPAGPQHAWMAIFLIVMVGKVTEWVPGLSGLPLAKVAFVFVVIYTARVWQKLVPVRVRSLPIAKPAIAFLVLSMLSVFFSIYKSNTLTTIEGSVIVLMAFVTLIKITQSMRDVETMLLALVGCAISLTIGVLVNYAGGRAHINDNFDPNDIAYVLDTLLPIVIAYGVAHSRRRKWLAYGLALTMILVILLTGSRGGAIGLGVVALFLFAYPLNFSKTGELRGIALGGTVVKLTLLVVLGVVVWGKLPGDTRDRLETLMDLQHDYNADPHSNASRTVLWRRDIELTLQRPIGYGAGSAPAVDGRLAGGWYRTAHNSFVQAFVELGVLGLVLFVSVYVRTWRELGRIAGRGRQKSADRATTKAALYARALRIGLLGNAVAGFFLSQAYSSCLFMTVAICATVVRLAPTASTATDKAGPSNGPVSAGAPA
jgi:putative inorganic carbon (hco3(-)) transporter